MPLRLFSAYGIELEYMLVDATSLDVAPRADWLLAELAGEPVTEFERGDFAWNNELALHVLELKTNGPVSQLDGLAAGFHAELQAANRILAADGLRLMPTGMHPWMDPARESRLWPHEDSEIYAAFDRIFGCAGHGWTNLQSMHLNLPFADDAEFLRLHAATRFLLPLLPSLAASTPLVESRLSGCLDNRLRHYAANCARLPAVTGLVVPEQVESIDDYQARILGRIYRDLAPLDPDGILQHEWVNARGAIPRFDRMALEIRVLDTQESALADLGFARLICATLKQLCEERWCSITDLQGWATMALVDLLDITIRDAERAEISSRRLLRCLGINRSTLPASGVWSALGDSLAALGLLDGDAEAALENYLRHGSLATRICAALPSRPQRNDIAAVYRRLCDCLAENELFPG